jgi:hypothetical protein
MSDQDDFNGELDVELGSCDHSRSSVDTKLSNGDGSFSADDGSSGESEAPEKYSSPDTAPTGTSSTIELMGGHISNEQISSPAQYIDILSAPPSSERMRARISSDTCCSICLSSYEEGDSVVGSANPNCRHAFHSHCIEEWLVLRKRGAGQEDRFCCPCCRQVFVFHLEEEDLPPVQS